MRQPYEIVREKFVSPELCPPLTRERACSGNEIGHGAALQTNHNASFDHLSHGEPRWLYFCCAMQIIIVCYSTKIRYCKLRTQRVREMAALERIDMLRQLIEMFRRANFSENTSLRGNVVIQ